MRAGQHPAATMKADGRVLKSELEEVKRYLLAHHSPERAGWALSVLRELLDKEINLGPVCEQIRWNMPHAGRLELLSLLVRISMADGAFHGAERNLTFRIARMLGVSAADYVSICAAATQYFRNREEGAGEDAETGAGLGPRRPARPPIRTGLTKFSKSSGRPTTARSRRPTGRWR